MTKTQAKSLVQALQKKFHGQAEAEPVNGHGRYRFAMTSPDAVLDISIILALAPADLAVKAG